MTRPLCVRSPLVAPLAPLALGCAVLAGCFNDRPARVPVSGQVLIDGQPLAHGFVQVLPEKDRPATASVGADGRFKLTTYDPDDGCVLGRHAAVVIATETLGPRGQRWHAPKKYANVETSALFVDITGPTDAVRLELSWDGGKPFDELNTPE